jgi:hypothetical protein
VATDTLAAILTLALLALVIVLLTGPFRPGRHGEGDSEPAPDELVTLEAQREAKYREIRDAELDFRTGKLSADDHALVVATLRAEAVDILKRLRRLEGAGAEQSARAGGELSGRASGEQPQDERRAGDRRERAPDA